MNECSISQDELDKLLNTSAKKAPSSDSKTGFSRTSILKKFEMEESELNRQIKDLNISLTQDEVDRLLKK